jgi:hypothetical protein
MMRNKKGEFMNKDTLKNATKLADACEKLCSDISEALYKVYPHTKDDNTAHDYSIGKKYIKIIETRDGHPSTVWGFINIANPKFAVGDVLKAAGWAAPALNKPRGNVFEGYKIGQAYPTHRVFGPDYLI